MTKIKTYLPAILSIFISFVFIQSLFFKFSGSPETVYIFTTLNEWTAQRFGLEGLFLPPGIFNAYVIGSAELISSLLLLGGLIFKKPLINVFGGLLALGVISGAIFFHLFTPLGIEVQGDRGALFGMAVGVWLSSALILFLRKDLLCGCPL